MTVINIKILMQNVNSNPQVFVSHSFFFIWLKNAIHEIDGWMTCDFTSFSTVFQSYQDNGQMINKGSVQWNSVYS